MGSEMCIRDRLGNINWGPLDYILFDLPPGTGNEQITIIDFIGEVDGAVVVTTPQDLAILDARKMISFSRDSNVPIVGVIENMSTMTCPHCEKEIDVFKKGGGKNLAEELVLPYLVSINLDGEIDANSFDNVIQFPNREKSEEKETFIYVEFPYKHLLPKLEVA